ncbi:MAG: phage tail protein [Planctomycetes bacterium]|nr:phage tail protein [Planctomycetota bacterium]
MPIPVKPDTLPDVFCSAGDFAAIPNASDASRASYPDGFPVATQLPLSNGGVAPNRLDFNGILRVLSAFAFLQQSGGQATYDPALNYITPGLVFVDGLAWFCKKENGPESANGVVTPGSDEEYWQDFFSYLTESSGGSSSFGVPVGTVITYYGTTAPEGYLALDGSSFSATDYPQLRALIGSSVLPDLRGYFVRGCDTRNTVDPNGSSRAIGSTQQDAIVDISGTLGGGYTPLAPSVTTTGAFMTGSNYSGTHRLYSGGGNGYRISYDIANVVGTSRVASEIRPKNCCLLYCIKHD